MPPRPLAAFAAELAHATDVHAALRALAAELADERHVGIALLRYDQRREALYAGRDAALASEHRDYLSLDHLPQAVQYAVLAGQRFVEVGDQGGQYARLLALEEGVQELRLYLKGIVVDGALSAVLALHDARRRGGGKLVERVEPLALLFELAYGRLYERDARFEAVAALHDVTSRLRAEHTSSMSATERELARLRAAVASGEPAGAAELRAAAERAARRATAAELRLAAVEEQVSSAVTQLERAHLQLHQQGETIREQAETIRRLELERGPGAPAR